ncbi:hypothetical protein KC340_g5519 [Hortaea werneckii]|nr:hypothetical protein KC342_g5687 [Hortaea werneckii]KAI7100287.1 hypothetical protein KC339_g7570 [Hortaea werneckii]KAI7242550.1 hypothetical protein KC365_g3067 [Hortaea werneckii]KAI7327646.1 hypothetical protein KC340_g5519 [Hortaea werneckii]KAI7404130.1 hypothetical protein KC328_g2050 [Hortaea werneckii]
MAKSLRPWLGDLVEGELNAVIEWHKAAQNAPKIKRDPDSRFHDDGSNFRSAVQAPTLTLDSKVQILEVICLSPSPLLLLSDGNVSVKAKLSDTAVSVIEDELEEPLSTDMKGDVISITSIKVVSTPYGPADGCLQLEVDNLQYLYHLRKTVGTPDAIGQRQNVSTLLEVIRTIRANQYTDTLPTNAPPQHPHLRENSIVPQSQAVVGSAHNGTGAPEAQPDERGSQPGNFSNSSTKTQTSPAIHSLQTQQIFATQAKAPLKKSRKGPSLGEEGYEMAGGVNLAKPLGPALGIDKNATPSPPRSIRTESSKTDTAQLLNLFGSGPKAPSRASNPKELMEIDVESSAGGDQVTAATPRVERLNTTDHEALHGSQRSVKRRRLSAQDSDTRIEYARRRIPAQQQNLLDRKESWFPSAPGQVFPVPNVPIELLKAWDLAARDTHAQSDEASHEENSGNVGRVASTVDRNDHDGAGPASYHNRDGEDLDISSSSGSNEEFSESQWPASQPTSTKDISSSPKRPALPPDSTGESTGGSCKASRSPEKPDRAQSRRPAWSSEHMPQATTIRELPHRSPQRHLLEPNPQPSSKLDRYVPEYSVLRQNRPSSSNDRDFARAPRPTQDRQSTHLSQVSSSGESNTYAGNPSGRSRGGSTEQPVSSNHRYGQPQRRWTARDGLPPQSSRLDNMAASSYQSPERLLSRGPSAARPDSSTRSAQTMQPPPSVDRYSPPRKSSVSSYLPSGGSSSARRRDPNDMAKKERSDQFRGEGALVGTGQNDSRGRPLAGSPSQQNSNAFDSHSSTSYAHGRNLASSRPFSQAGESYYGMFSAIRARQLSNSPTSNRVVDSSQRFFQRSSRNTPNHYAGSHASVPSKIDGATVIKGTQYSDDGCEIEMGVPRPLQDPAWEHRQRRSEHYRDVQRKEWLLANFVVSYNAGPYISNVHREYVQSHPADQIPANDLKRAIHAAFPALAGQAGARSLKRKGSVPALSSSLNATPVGLPQLDGSNAADESPRLDPARDEQSSRNTTIKPHTKQRLAMAGRGGDRLSASQPWSERPRGRPNVLLGTLAMKAIPSTEAESPREIEYPTNSSAKVSRQALSMPYPNPADRQEDTDRDPHREDRRASPPSSVFADFASAWKSLAPGGAFARHQPDMVPDQRRRERRPMDLLGWRL